LCASIPMTTGGAVASMLSSELEPDGLSSGEGNATSS
jgi:hypothetical protein